MYHIDPFTKEPTYCRQRFECSVSDTTNHYASISEAVRARFNLEAAEALANLNGTTEAAVSVMTGFSSSDLESLGGVPL